MALCDRCSAEILEPAHRLPLPWFDHDLRLIAGRPCTTTRWRLLEILWRRRNRYVSRDTLHSLLYQDRLDDPPDDCNVVVLLCYLRRLLKHTPYRIECLKYTGYRLVGPCPASAVESQTLWSHAVAPGCLDTVGAAK